MFMDMGGRLRKATGFMRRHGGKVAYYACVAAALVLVAVAAEQYRADDALPTVDAQAVPAAGIEAELPVQQETRLLQPEGMVLIRAYSDYPQWNKVLGHWETHGAADYCCEGENVRSISDGVIVALGKSGEYGSYLDVESGEYLLRYASVQPEEELQPGKQVSENDLIGRTNASMPGEGYAGAHLHLEIYRNGTYVDPETLLK